MTDDLKVPFQDFHKGDAQLILFMEGLAAGTAHPMRAIEVASTAVADVNSRLHHLQIEHDKAIKKGVTASDIIKVSTECQECRDYLHNFEVVTRNYDIAAALIIGAINATIYQEIYITQNTAIEQGKQPADDIGVAIDMALRNYTIQ